ncbi:hypothetical protein CEXT_811681 [Caerostris extrusa]|uniref:Uncharacterized protein n=1 Tax=Caerostris extrusa TaxID=172846 RepID=A0AAV4TY87_CAEEX|nr:hypothetical protein CEXT_811681 [Caerostris extrusa]
MAKQAVGVSYQLNSVAIQRNKSNRLSLDVELWRRSTRSLTMSSFGITPLLSECGRRLLDLNGNVYRLIRKLRFD